MQMSPHVKESTSTGRRGLRALVRTNDGWAVPHAVATVTDTSGRQIARVEAAADGAVRTGPLPPGAYTVVITAAGYAPAAATAIATAAGTADLGSVVLARQGGAELPPPGVWIVDPAHSTVAATTQHLGLSTVHGRFTEFAAHIDIAGAPEASTVTAVIEAASIDTGNGMRDDHLRSADFLDVEKHPAIMYHGAGLTATGPDRWTVHGDLTLSGVTRPVDLDLTYLGTGPDAWGGLRAAFRAITELHRQDFAMNFNQVVQAGIFVVGATLKVELDVQAVWSEQQDAGPHDTTRT